MTNVYSTACTPWFIAAQQAVPAGAAPVNLLGGSLKVGDGNGATPTISQIIANGGVLRQVWAGAPNSVTVDATNTGQIDVGCLIPTVDGSGAEIGPFNVTEFAIYDATGNLAIVGTTNLQKTTSAQGQLMTLQWFACYIAAAADAVTIQPPAGSWPTLGALQAAIAGLLSANLPITVTPALQSSGWTTQLLNIASATLAALGTGRPATNAEFAAGASQTSFIYPWPTLQQVTGAFAALTEEFANYQPVGSYQPAGNYLPTAAYVGGAGPTTVNVGLSADIALSNLVLTTLFDLTGTSTANLTVAGSAVTVDVSGLYQVALNTLVSVTYSSASLYWGNATLYRNGAPILELAEGAYFPGVATSGIGLNGMRTLRLNAGDVLTLSAEATATALTSASVSAAATFIDITRLA